MTAEGEPAPDNVLPFRRKPPKRPDRPKCPACGGLWAPGPTSDPAWLLTASPELGSYYGVLHCPRCGRRKLDALLGRDTRPK